MMNPALDIKSPAEIADYGLDWTDRINDADITIATSTWEIENPTGSPDLEIEGSDKDGNITVVRLSGGEADRDYTLINTVVLSDSRELIAAIEVRVRTPAIASGIY